MTKRTGREDDRTTIDRERAELARNHQRWGTKGTDRTAPRPPSADKLAKARDAVRRARERSAGLP